MRTSSEARRTIVGAIVGLLYGSVLAFLSFLANFAGHGTELPLLLSSAPFGVLDLAGELVGAPYVGYGRVATLLSVPLVWATFGSLVALSGRGRRLRAAQVLALLHYASGLALVAIARDEPAHLQRVLQASPEFTVAWVTVYLVGQMALWWQIGRRNQPTV
jgi:hypothetical protein